MAILSISRDWGIDPQIVRIVTNDTIATVTGSGYITAQEANIELLQNGDFEWRVTDLILIYATDGEGFYTRNATTNSFVANPAGAGLSQTLPSGDIFVGSAGNIATGVAPSGDIASISNAGLVTIANNAITTAKILNANVTLAKLAAGITPSHVVKFAGKVANGGGSATIALTVTGVLSTDVVFAAVQASTNAVSVQKVTPTTDTITVLLSGDPGAATTISYEALRVAA